jgi:5'-methylthioadenosine phosphorylase
MLAIIGGSGLTQLSSLEVGRRKVVRTPYGDPSGALTFGRIGRCDVVFLARHGYGHTIVPHEVNYRANVWACARKASIRSSRSPRSAASATTSGPARWCCRTRSSTTPGAAPPPSSKGPASRSTTSISPSLTRARCASAFLKAAGALGERLMDGGVYAATQGPRLETAAEITRLGARRRRSGRHDRHAGSGARARAWPRVRRDLRWWRNYAAGRGDSERAIALDKIQLILDEALGRVRKIIAKFCEQKE